MGLGKHFYNHEHKLTINQSPSNYALDIIDFILQRRKYLTVGKIIEKAKYEQDIDQKLKSEDQKKKKQQMRNIIVEEQPKFTESEEEYDEGDDLVTMAEKKRK